MDQSGGWIVVVGQCDLKLELFKDGLKVSSYTTAVIWTGPGGLTTANIVKSLFS